MRRQLARGREGVEGRADPARRRQQAPRRGAVAHRGFPADGEQQRQNQPERETPALAEAGRAAREASRRRVRRRFGEGLCAHAAAQYPVSARAPD